MRADQPPIPAGFAWREATPIGRSGAIGVIEIIGDVAKAARALGASAPHIGAIRHSRVADVDEAVLARWRSDSMTVTPHAGPASMKAIGDRLRRAGGEMLDAHLTMAQVMQLHPEARGPVEALAIEAIPRVASPLAVDLLLMQRDRWESPGAHPDPHDTRERDMALARLVRPPVVVAWGRTNIGKSTLLNALARKAVALSGDAPGVTRDHVGVELDLDGLVVRYIDTPGLDTSGLAQGVARTAMGRASALAASADLLLVCVDAGGLPPPAPPRSAPVPRLTIGLRADRGAPACEVDCLTSGATGEGVQKLAGIIKESLTPKAHLDDVRPWRFWDAIEGLPGPESAPGR